MDNLFKKFRNHSLSFEVKQQIEAALIEYAYSQSTIAMAASLFCGLIIFISLFSTPSKILLFSWLLIFLVIMIARISLVIIYKKLNSPGTHLVFWNRLFTIGAFLGGLSWGLIGVLLFPYVDTLQQIVCILVVAGISAGSIITLSVIPSAALGFVALAIIPFIIQLQFFQDKSYTFFDLTMIAYLVFLSVLSIRNHHMIKNMVYLRFQNDTLLNKYLELNETLENIATHDPLTLLDNSRLFYINLANAIKRAERYRKTLALIYFDLDKFKLVNDTYGHDMGDQLLLAMAEKLKKSLRKGDLIARLGGDEFAIIFEEVDNIKTVALLARKICKIISTPILINDAEIQITASLGISIYPSDGIDAHSLVRNADKAMYYVKEHGRDNFHFNMEELNLIKVD